MMNFNKDLEMEKLLNLNWCISKYCEPIILNYTVEGFSLIHKLVDQKSHLKNRQQGLYQKCLAKYLSKLFCCRGVHKNVIFNELFFDDILSVTHVFIKLLMWTYSIENAPLRPSHTCLRCNSGSFYAQPWRWLWFEAVGIRVK
jgi:hypothetical protein